jgi:hypothetical protein
MDFEVAGKFLETEFAGDLQPRNEGGLDNREYLTRFIDSGFFYSKKLHFFNLTNIKL